MNCTNSSYFSTLLIILLFFVAGCVNTKKYNEVKIKKGEEYYSLTYHASGPDDSIEPDTIIYTIKKAAEGHLGQVEVVNDSILKLRPTAGLYEPTEYKIVERQITNTTFNRLKGIAGAGGVHNVFPSPLQEFETKIGDVVVFNSIPIPRLDEVNENKKLKKSASFNYLEHQALFQVVTVPIKFRNRPREGVPPQVTSTVNVGFAYAHRFTYRKFTQRYRRSMFLNATHSTFSLTPGLFIGPTLVSLENEVNVKKPIDPDRHALGISGGAYLAAGTDKFSIGLAVGVDHALDRDAKEWVYQDHPLWYGLLFGFSLGGR